MPFWFNDRAPTTTPYASRGLSRPALVTLAAILSLGVVGAAEPRDPDTEPAAWSSPGFVDIPRAW